MTIMLTFKCRLYTLAFYRQLKNQAEDAVRVYQENGYYALKRKVRDRHGVPVWGIYTAGKKSRCVEKMNEEDDCFGHYPDNECDQATCKDLCQDIEECKGILET